MHFPRRRRVATAGLLAGAVSIIVCGPLASPAAAADCTVVSSGDVLVDPGASPKLTADVSAGPLGSAFRRVAFTASDGAGSVLRYSALTDLSGRASVAPPLPEGIYGIVASVAPDASHPGCSTATEPNDTLLSVTTAGSRFGATGAISTTSGTVRFGLHLRVLPDATTTGRIQLRLHPPNPALPARVFRAITVNVPPDPSRPCQADVTGSGVLDGEPGYTYALSALDTGKKANDAFSLALGAPDGSVLFSSDGLRSLSKGRITYHPPNPARPSDGCSIGA